MTFWPRMRKIAVSAGRNQQGRQTGVELVLCSNFLFVEGPREDGIDRNAGHADGFRPDSDSFQEKSRLFDGDKIPIVVMTEPERVGVEVGYHDSMPGSRFLFSPHP